MVITRATSRNHLVKNMPKLKIIPSKKWKHNEEIFSPAFSVKYAPRHRKSTQRLTYRSLSSPDHKYNLRPRN